MWWNWCERPGGRSPRPASAPEAEADDQSPVPLDVVLLHVVEKAPPTDHQHQQTSPAVVVLLVGLQVLGEVVDALGEDRDLHLGRARVSLVKPVLADRGGLVGHY